MTENSTPAPALSPLLDEDPAQIGGHTLVGRIGAGGMGTVFAASAPDGGYLAIKVIHTDHAADPDFRARFAREVDLVRRVTGPRVPAFHGADPDAEAPWLATEYVPGRTVADHLDTHGPLTGGMLLGFAAGTAEALRVVHATGVVHRDLKPGNVILAADGPKVLDFGIARAVEETALTRTGGVVGTPGWIAPEHYQGAEITAAADMFAWGALVAYAATGANPFGTGAPNALAYRVLHGEPDLAGVPGELLPLLRAALERDPARRPAADEAVQSVHSLWRHTTQAAPADDEATAVQHLLGREWTEVHTALPAAPPPPRRRRGLVIALAAAVALGVVAAGGIATATLLTGDDDQRTEQADGDNGATTAEDVDAAADSADQDNGPEDDEGEDTAEEEADEQDEPELPPEATDFASSGGNAPNTAEVTQAGPDGATVQMSYNQGFATTEINLNQVQSASDAVQFELELTQAGANAMPFSGLGSATFYLVEDGTPFTSQEAFVYEVDPNQGINHSEDRTLTYTGAPENGLMVIHPPLDDEQLSVPPIGVCYDVDAGFSTDYESCV
jgi:eukaryotic-like serine/threonine-protein kinase